MKKFLIIGNLNAITNKDVFPSIMYGEVWAGVHFNKSMYFEVPETFVYSEKYKSDRERNGKNVCLVVGCGWFTNLGENNRPPMELTEHYSPEKYPKYDNYSAIEVSNVKDIPLDYDEVIGVPITFIDKYCPQQFEIVGVTHLYDKNSVRTKVYSSEECRNAYFKLFGKEGMYPLNSSPVIIKDGVLKAIYKRILIKRKK